MRATLASGASGLVFGLGLGISGMTRADKVINFLDLTDAWDPSLAFVMLGAIAVHLVVHRVVIGRLPGPWFGDRFALPTRTDIDARLVGGAALFGVGWGLGGYCPGPGLVSLPTGAPNALAFAGGLTAGMMLFHAADAAWQRRHQPPPMVASAEDGR